MRGTTFRTWLPFTIGVLTAALAWWALRPRALPGGLEVTLEVTTTCPDKFELFWDNGSSGYEPDRMMNRTVMPAYDLQRIRFQLPDSVHRVRGLRIDPGTQAVQMTLKAIELRGPFRTKRLEGRDITDRFGAANDLRTLEVDTMRNIVPIKCTGTDPYLASTIDLGALSSEVMDSSPPYSAPLLLALLIGALFAWAARIITLPQDTGHRPAPPGEPRSMAVRVTAGLIATMAGLVVTGIADNINFHDRALMVDMEVEAARADNFQIFYADRPGGFSEAYYVNCPVQAARGAQLLSFRMPADTLFKFVRFDPGNAQDSLSIRSMSLRCNDKVRRFDAADLFDLLKPNGQVEAFEKRDSTLFLRFNGNDPYLFSDTDFGEDVRALWEDSGNGPLPFCTGLICAIAVFAGLIRSRRLATLITSARPVEWATGIGFCSLISLPMLSDVLPIQPSLADTEKRPLAEKPLLRMHSLEAFPDKYTRYYADHFGYRKLLFRWNSIFHTYALHCSSMPDNVVFGKDGYLFLVKPGVGRYFRNQPVLTEADMKRIAQRLDHRKKWLAGLGIDYYLVVPPLKASMYPEKLPDKYRKVDDRSVLDDLKDYLDEHSSVELIDLRPDLAEAKKIRDIYYTTDIHWNPWGGLIGYRTLMHAMLKDHPELGLPCLPEDYAVEADTNDQGDLALQIALNDKLTRVTYMMVPKIPFRAKETGDEPLPGDAFFKYKPVFAKGPDPKAPKLLMFRDSFAVYLMPYLNEHFSRSVYVWTPILLPEIVEKEKPDIVVQEIMELFLPDLLEDKLTDPL